MTKQPIAIYRTANPAIFHITSETRPGCYYAADRVYGGCNCPGYRGYGHCKHGDALAAFAVEDLALLAMTPFGPKSAPQEDLFARLARSNDVHYAAVR